MKPISKKEKVPIYFMPGMSANPKIFERLQFDREIYACYFLDWLEPTKNESLISYCKRLITKIKHPNPILIGVSFGGIVVQEIAKLISHRQVIIISSVKDPREFSKRIYWAKQLRLYHYFPTQFITPLEEMVKKIVSSKKIKQRIDLYQVYLTHRSQNYLNWSFKTIMHWKNENPITDIVHIHGDKDHIFPIQKIKNAYIIKGGTHAMILIKSGWLNAHLPRLLKKE